MCLISTKIKIPLFFSLHFFKIRRYHWEVQSSRTPCAPLPCRSLPRQSFNITILWELKHQAQPLWAPVSSAWTFPDWLEYLVNTVVVLRITEVWYWWFVSCGKEASNSASKDSECLSLLEPHLTSFTIYDYYPSIPAPFSRLFLTFLHVIVPLSFDA